MSLSERALGRLDRNVLFLGTGLKPTEEPSEVTEPVEVWLDRRDVFSGETGSGGKKQNRQHEKLSFIFPDKLV